MSSRSRSDVPLPARPARSTAAAVAPPRSLRSTAGARAPARSASAPRSAAAPPGERGGDTANGVPGRERVGELQRARILAAMIELVCERGAAGVTVAHIVTRSGVSRRTFYDLFEDREDCLLIAFNHAVERAAMAVLPIYEAAREDGWEWQIRVALEALLRFLDDEPAVGRLLVVDALAAEQRVLERRARVVDLLVDAAHRGARAHGKDARRPARIVAEGAVGAVLAVIHARLCEPSSKSLSGLLNPLMGIVVLPYLGPAAAERELKRPAPRVRKRPPASSDPLRELDMRLTYRTVRVLLAIAELGGRGAPPSGRQVADASDISDQGQMSKLLWRLESLGLIRNGAAGRGKGEPNAWALTAKGQDVARAIQSQTSA
jgi:AcrR family transcriptional regulator